MQKKSALEETFDGYREGHSALSEDQWRERLQSFLENRSDLQKPFRVTEIKRPPSGLSVVNLIITVERNDAVDHYVARIEPEKSFYTRYDLREQFEAYRYLNSVGLPVPSGLWMDDEGDYLGRPGFVMEFWVGKSSTSSYFTDGPLAHISDDQRFRMLRNLVETTANLHDKADPFAIKSLTKKGHGETWLEREINHWYDVAMEAHPSLGPSYEPVRKWLISQAPAAALPVFLHGDFNAANVLWDGEKIAAVLDLESIRIGQRESDITYQYVIDQIAGNFFTTGVEIPSLAQRASWYKEVSGTELGNLDYHEIRMMFQLSCAAVFIARFEQGDLAIKPTPFMDFLNRRLMAIRTFEHKLPTLGG